MLGQTVNTEIADSLTITSLLPLGDKGGQGRVYQTDNAKYPVKVWDPDEPDPRSEPDRYRAAWNEARRRYGTFARLHFVSESELTCLPLAFVEVNGRPAYLMERASGKEMAEEWSCLMKLDLTQRMRIAYSLANAISVLHSHYVVHADIKRDNFFFDPQTCSVQVLDIDGGGYFGSEPKTEQFPPNVHPILKYLSPELRRNKFSWNGIWEDERLRIQPDLWALATLIYDIIVDSEGPFPQKYFDRRGSFMDHPDWPVREQERKFKALEINKELIDLFREVFCARNRTRVGYQRPTAAHWGMTLRSAIEHRLPRHVKCPRCQTAIQDLSLMICPRCAAQQMTVALWGYTTCPKGHKTPAKSPHHPSRGYCKHQGCGRELR